MPHTNPPSKTYWPGQGYGYANVSPENYRRTEIMKSKNAQKVIIVQKYEHGKPFPGLYAQFDFLPKLPQEAQLKCIGGMRRTYYVGEGGMNAKCGIVSTRDQGLVLVLDGEYMQVTGEDKEGTDGYNRPLCIGRMPGDYTPIATV